MILSNGKLSSNFNLKNKFIKTYTKSKLSSQTSSRSINVIPFQDLGEIGSGQESLSTMIPLSNNDVYVPFPDFLAYIFCK